MGKKTIRHLDFEALVEINSAVVSLTKEAHGYSEADGEKLTGLVKEVEGRADNLGLEEAIPDKASLLVFKIASGQYFKAGNKRTALVAGSAFLAKNGYSINIRDENLVSMVDKAGMGAATLDDVFAAIRGSMAKRKPERKGWEGIVGAIVESNMDFLVGLTSQA